MSERISTRVLVYSTNLPIYDYEVASLADVPHIGDMLSFVRDDTAFREVGKVVNRNVYYAVDSDTQLRVVSIRLTVKFPAEKWLCLWNEWYSDNHHKPFDKLIRGSNKYLWNCTNKGEVAFFLRHAETFGLDENKTFLLDQFMNSKNPNEKYYE